MSKHDNKPQNRPNQVIVQQQIRAYSGPVPEPQFIEAYEKILPGSANRLLTMAEERQRAEIMLAKRASTFELSKPAIVVVALIGGFALAILNKDLLSYGVLVGEIAILIGGFIYSKKVPPKNIG